MSIAVRVSDDLAEKAKIHSNTKQRSVAGQIEYWAKMGQILEDNPDLSFNLVQDILLAREEAEAGLTTEYEFSS